MKIQGMGWVTPLGTGIDEVTEKLRAGACAEVREITSPHSTRKHFYMPVPQESVAALGKNPRFRRASAITYFTAAAGLAALENAALKITPEIAARTALIFAVASGGVVYTQKFYDAIARQGASAASPLLFPETVFNAPASHLAALLGIDGITYTLIGDSSVGLSAMKTAEHLLGTGQVDYALVVGGEEVDWILCEGYRAWRLISSKSSVEIGSSNGAILAEGAAALLLSRDGKIEVAEIHDGVSFFAQHEVRAAMRQVYRDVCKSHRPEMIVSCANGTFLDRAEGAVIGEFFPDATVFYPKRQLGEALGASALMQVIVGAQALTEGGPVMISSCGWNQQASGAILRRA